MFGLDSGYMVWSPPWVPSVYYMSGFVYACLCVWLLACNLTTAETRISSLSVPHRQHRTTIDICLQGQAKLNPSGLRCTKATRDARWHEANRGEPLLNVLRFAAESHSTARMPTPLHHRMPRVPARRARQRYFWEEQGFLFFFNAWGNPDTYLLSLQESPTRQPLHAQNRRRWETKLQLSYNYEAFLCRSWVDLTDI